MIYPLLGHFGLNKQKETVKIVIVGHVDHGKSTLIGRLLLDTNSLPKEKLNEIKKISQELGKDAELAFLTDQLKEERERAMTIDTTQTFFKTRNRNYVVIDAPGHVEFIKNMLTGASNAQVAILIVDVNEGIKEQTRRHAYLINMIGIDKLIVVLNKMDMINYAEEKFQKLKNELCLFLQEMGIRPLFIIPISAREGENVLKKTVKLSWYKKPTLIKALDSIKLNSAKSSRRPLRLPIQDIYDIGGRQIIVGRIVSGVIRRGQKVCILPSFKEATVETLEIFKTNKILAKEGENVGLTLKEPLAAKRGDIVVQGKNMPKPGNCFEGHIFWMSNEPLEINKTLTLRCSTQEVECAAENIKNRINSSTLEVIEENARELKLNEAGIVIFRTKKPIVFEPFSFVEEMGRFILQRDHNLQGAGIIMREQR